MRNHAAGDHGIQGGGKGCGRKPKLARLVLIHFNAQLPRGFDPVEAWAAHPATGRDHLREFLRYAANALNLRPQHAVLNGPANRWAQFQRRHARNGGGELFGKQGFDARLQAFARLKILRHHNGLGKERVRQLHIERQIEADRAAPDIAAPMRNIRVFGEGRIQPFHRCLRRVD